MPHNVRARLPDHPMTIPRLTAVLAGLCALPTVAGATQKLAQPLATSPVSITTVTAADLAALQEVVIQASRTGAMAFGYPGSVSTTTADTLTLLGATHSSEALNRNAGAFLQRGSGEEVLVALRSPVLAGPGACGAFLVMEDGIPLRPVGACNVNELFEVNLEQADAVEVIRGPGLGPQGANALHGQVNVRSVALDAPTRLALELGDFGYARAKVQGSLTLADGEDGKETDRVAYAFHATQDHGWREATGFRERKANLKWGTGLGNGQLVTSLALTELDQETGGFINGTDAYRSRAAARANANPEAFRQASASRVLARWTEDAAQGWEVNWFARASRMRFLQHFLLGKPLERNGQQSTGLMASRGFSWAGLQWRAGLDAETANTYLVEFQAGPTLEGSAAARAIRPAGLHYDYRVEARSLAPWLAFEYPLATNWSLTGSLRHDRTRYAYDNRMSDGNTSATGSTCPGGCLYSRPADRQDRFATTTPRLALAWQPNAQLTAWTSVSRGFRPPEATELYRLQRQQRVADLAPETARAAELGVRGRTPRLAWSVVAYTMDKQHVILRDASAFNVSDGRTRHRGIEAEIAWSPTDWLTLSGEGTIARHTYRFDRAAEQGERILRGNDVDTAPRRLHTVRATVQPLPSVQAELEWVTVGAYFADAANTARYPGHDLLNLRAVWSPTPQWSLTLRGTNLTDRAYADRADLAFGAWRYFPGRPRAVFLEAAWQR